MTHVVTSLPLDALRSHFRGQLVTPDDGDYDDGCRIWNGTIHKRPALIARCTGTADVIAALRFGREQQLEIAVRSGGHNVAGTALSDGGLVIDLQLLKGVRVDPESRRLLAQPGLRLGEVDHETQAFGLALPSGINSETGLAGLTLGGGIGWQMRKYGLTIDYLVFADVVTANGEVLRVSADQNPELFWALRGGGGNFGIVTAFEFDLMPVGPDVYGGIVLYPAERAGEVLRAYRDWADGAPDEVTTILILRRNAFSWSPSESHGQPIVGVGALFSGPAHDGERALAPLMQLGPVLANSLQVRRFTQHQAMLDASAPAGRLYYWKSHYLPPLTDAAIEVIASYAWRFSSPFSFTLLSHLGGAIRRHSEEDTAFTGREAEFVINMNCAATEPALYEQDRAWVREWFDALTPHSTGGVYVNFLGEDAGDLVRAAYGEAKYARLAALKANYDPENVFRVNQNIAPLSQAAALPSRAR